MLEKISQKTRGDAIQGICPNARIAGAFCHFGHLNCVGDLRVSSHRRIKFFSVIHDEIKLFSLLCNYMGRVLSSFLGVLLGFLLDDIVEEGRVESGSPRTREAKISAHRLVLIRDGRVFCFLIN